MSETGTEFWSGNAQDESNLSLIKGGEQTFPFSLNALKRTDVRKMDSICQGFDGYQPKATPSRTIRSDLRRAQNIEHDTDGSGNIRSCSLSVFLFLFFVCDNPSWSLRWVGGRAESDGLELDVRQTSLAHFTSCVYLKTHIRRYRCWIDPCVNQCATGRRSHVRHCWLGMCFNHLQQWVPVKIHFKFPREVAFLCQKRD